MARIISSRKKYVPVKDLVVYPSKTETIEVIPDDGSWRGNDNKFLWTSAIDDVYGIDFMESLPNIDDGEMVEIRIKCTAEKCE